MKISTNLPDTIKGITYFKNSHYIELEDDRGCTHKVLAHGLLRGKCTKCDFEFYSPTNPGDVGCPCCYSKIEWTWGRPQLCFVPEKATDFAIYRKKQK